MTIIGKKFDIKHFHVYRLDDSHTDSLVMFTDIDKLKYAYDDEIVLKLARHTKNTWQKNRDFSECTFVNDVRQKNTKI